MRALIDAAPLLTEHLDDESRRSILRRCAARSRPWASPTQVNPRLVRGLDYYSRTVFEWITDALGAQDAVCSGGRYDGLIAQLGGEATPAIGFAAGDRADRGADDTGRRAFRRQRSPDLYLVASGERAERAALRLAEALRDALPGRGVAAESGRRQFQDAVSPRRSQRCPWALILGDEELDRGVVAVKPLRREGGQSDCPLAQLPAHIASLL